MLVWMCKHLFIGEVDVISSLSKSRRFLFLIGLIVTMGGCDTNRETIPVPPPEYNNFDLIKSSNYRESGLVSDSVALDSLVKYLEKYPELTLMLQSPDEYTLFAPSNKAFKELLKTPVFSAVPGGLDAMNPDVLKNILSYHLVTSKHLLEDLTPESELASLSPDPLSPSNFQQIKVNADITLQGGGLSKTVHIESANNLSINGVVHTIGSVLLPPSVDPLSTIIGTVAFEVLVRDNFSDIAKLIQLADRSFKESEVEREFKIQTLLALPKDNTVLTDLSKVFKEKLSPLQPDWVPGITFLAVSDDIIDAIKSLTQFVADASSEDARQFLLNHIIFGEYKSTDLQDGLLLYTMYSGFRSLETSPSTLEVVVENSAPPLNPCGIALSTKNLHKAYVQCKQHISTTNGLLYVIYGDLTPD